VRDPDGSLDPSDAPSRPPDPRGNIQPTGPGPLVVLGALAAVFGWLVRPITIRLDVAEPVIAVWTVVVVFLLAAGVGFVAWRTWRILQRPTARGVEPLLPYQAVNRLLLGKAAAMAGAMVLGGYAGFAIAHLGITPTELSRQRLVRSGLASLGGLLLMVAGLVLERACRVRGDGDRSVP